jgi:hypothetical protein
MMRMKLLLMAEIHMSSLIMFIQYLHLVRYRITRQGTTPRPRFMRGEASQTPEELLDGFFI